MAQSEVHDVVVLGASYAGLSVIHAVLKAVPTIQSQSKKKVKVTILSNSTHFWFSVGAPRAMLYPYPKSNDDSFIPVTKGLTQYPSEHYSFIHAEITALDTTTREVSYQLKDDSEQIASGTQQIHFDTLVIALGSTGDNPLYAIKGSHVPTLRAYEDIQARLPAAKTIAIIGGGSAGVETGGELGHLHGKKSANPKEITVYSGTDRLLKALRPAIAKRAEEMLTGYGVKVVHGLRMESSKKLQDGTEELTFSDGSKRTVDLLIVATGRFPASSVLPAAILDDKKRVKVDDYQRVIGLESVYAVGDIASNSPQGVLQIVSMGPATGANVIAELSGKGKGKPWKPMTDKEMQIVPVGPTGGVGAIFGWWAPSFAVKMIKAKTFMFATAEKTVMGTA